MLGYADVPPGCVACVVTCLEMFERPALAPAPLPPGVVLQRNERVDIEAYRALFRQVGADWLWTSRLAMSDEDLAATLADPRVEVFAIHRGDRDVGLLELDFREAGQCELAFLGLDGSATGQGLGRRVVNVAIAMAWSRPIDRLWIHTCSFDHPAALRLYSSCGFVPYAFQVEVVPDPRITGHLPTDVAPHVPLILPQS